MLREARGGKLLVNPAKLTSFLNAATKAITVDTGTSIADLKTLFDVLRGLDPKKVTFYTAPIANAAYDPNNPSSTHGSRVLLDAKAGKVLYDQIISDSTVTRRTKPKAGDDQVTVAPKTITVDVRRGVGHRATWPTKAAAALVDARLPQGRADQLAQRGHDNDAGDVLHGPDGGGAHRRRGAAQLQARPRRRATPARSWSRSVRRTRARAR